MTKSVKKKLGFALFIITSIILGPDLARKVFDVIGDLPVMEERR
jgi:hypothetical protein